MADVIEVATELLRIPSHEDESAAGEFIYEWCRDVPGGDVCQDDAGNVIARKGTGEPSIALVGHHDVVPPGPDQIDDGEYVLETKDGRIYGRGAADMKGSLAAAMCAFRDCDPDVTVIFASFVGEEIGGEGAQYAIDSGFDPDYAIVGEGSTSYSEPGMIDVVVAHRGRREHTFAVAGTAGHAGEPENTDNAIYNAAPVITGIEEIDHGSGTYYDTSMRGSIVATNITDGGNPTNTVPDTCTITVDERTLPERAISEEDVVHLPYDTWESTLEFPPMVCEEQSFAAMVRGAATAVQERQASLITKPQSTDAGWLGKNGTTCVVCGASEPGEAHTNTESVSQTVLKQCKQIYQEAAERMSD